MQVMLGVDVHHNEELIQIPFFGGGLAIYRGVGTKPCLNTLIVMYSTLCIYAGRSISWLLVPSELQSILIIFFKGATHPRRKTNWIL